MLAAQRPTAAEVRQDILLQVGVAVLGAVHRQIVLLAVVEEAVEVEENP
jgi:hypothetical protein